MSKQNHFMQIESSAADSRLLISIKHGQIKTSHMEWQNGDFTISTDPARLDVIAIHQFLSNDSYWAVGRPMEVVQKSIENSLVFGLFKGNEQAGFARVVTDRATFAWVCDVFVMEKFRGQGLGKWLMSVIVGHPDLQSLRRWILTTKDAHGLYEQFEFTELQWKDRFMERFVDRPDYDSGVSS